MAKKNNSSTSVAKDLAKTATKTAVKVAGKPVGKAAAKKVQSASCAKATGLYIPAGIFLGLGIGMLLGQAGAGILIGLGTGFLALAIVKRS